MHVGGAIGGAREDLRKWLMRRYYDVKQHDDQICAFSSVGISRRLVGQVSLNPAHAANMMSTMLSIWQMSDGNYSTKPQDTMHVIAAALAAVFACSGVAASAAEPVIGNVTRCEGKCVETSGTTNKPLAGRDPVRLMERASTGADSPLEVGFPDGNRLPPGEKASVILDALVYDPDGRNRFHATVIGAFRHLSGK